MLQPVKMLWVAGLLGMAGCGGVPVASVVTQVVPTVTFTGGVHGGQQPVTGATVALYVVGQGGDGSAAASLMTSTVVTNGSGQFTLTGAYTCPVATPTFPGQVFLVATGGNPGLGTGGSNPQLTLMAGLGICSQLQATTTVQVNELTTVATVAALYPYMSGATGMGSAASDAAGLNGAMALVNEYVNTTTGYAPGTAVVGYGVPLAPLVSLANAVSACVNTSGGVSGDGTACGKLFLYAKSSGGVAPTDTVGALINILNAPTTQVGNIFGLVPATPPFGNGLTMAPTTWALPITYSGGGVVSLAASAASVNENGGAVTLVVTHAEGDTGAVSVGYTTANGTATAGTDYTATSGSLSWGNGDASSRTITVPILDASVYGGTRTFTVALGTATGGATLGATTTATVTINDSDVQASFYVATTGNDTTGTGTIGAPFATLGRAQTAMRGGTTKVTQVESGTYYLTTPLALTSADNGETWEAAPGATPVISGGVPVTGWTSVGGGMYRASTTATAGIDVEIGGVRQYPAAIGWDALRPYMTGWRVIDNSRTASGNVLNVYAADLTASAMKVGAIVQTFDNSSRYTDHFDTVASWSTTNNTVTMTGFAGAPQYGAWRILGDYEDISGPGQFGFDAANNYLYLEPTSACGLMTNSVAVVAQLSALITVKTVSNVTITGLTFSDTVAPRFNFTDYTGVYNSQPQGTIQGSGLSNSIISHNNFVNAGNGISLISSTNNTMSFNTFDQMGGSGFLLKTQSNGNQIRNNTMTSLGRINAGSYGVYVADSASVTIDSNYVNGTGRNAISISINDQTSTSNLAITNNVVINTTQQTNDSAAIYLYAGNNSTYANISSVITGNRVENTGGLLQNAAGVYEFAQSRGIYMDDKVSGVTVNGNVTENNMDGILLCHGCTTNSASYNVNVQQSSAQYANYQGTTSAGTGAMTLNGTTSINLLPSYFPASVPTSVIVVQLSGGSTGSISPQFNVLADGVVIGTSAVAATGVVTQFVYTANLTPRMTHTIGVQLVNGANTGSSTQSLAGMVMYVNNSFVSLAAGSEYGMQILSDSATNQPNVTNFSYTHNIVYRGYGAGADVNLGFNANGYVDSGADTLDYNVTYNGSMTKVANNGYLPATPSTHSLVVNPQFVDAAVGDYSLGSGSPAYGLGFVGTGVPLAPAATYPATAVTGCTVY